jgi:hypothetical protein
LVADSAAATAWSIRNHQQAIPVGEIDPAAGHEAHLTARRQDFEELLQLDGAPGEAVDVVDHHRIAGAVGEVGEHAPVAMADLAGIGRYVVVDVVLGHRPTEVGGQTAAVLYLASDAEAGTLLVAGDASVDGGCSDDAHRGHTNEAWSTSSSTP